MLFGVHGLRHNRVVHDFVNLDSLSQPKEVLSVELVEARGKRFQKKGVFSIDK